MHRTDLPEEGATEAGKNLGTFLSFLKKNIASVLMISYMGVLVLILTQKSLPLSNIERAILVHSSSLISLYYIIHRWGRLISWVWTTKLAGLLYLLLSAALYAASRVLADHAIETSLQTAASQLPNAQNFLTLYYIVSLTILFLGMVMKSAYYIAIILAVILVPYVLILWLARDGMLPITFSIDSSYASRIETQPLLRLRVRNVFPLAVDVFVLLSLGTYTVQIPILLERPFWTEGESNVAVTTAEKLLIISSFYRNDVNNTEGSKAGKLICGNLPPNVHIAIIKPDDVVPKEVMMANIKSKFEGKSGNAYSYQLSKCDNTNDPDYSNHK